MRCVVSCDHIDRAILKPFPERITIRICSEWRIYLRLSTESTRTLCREPQMVRCHFTRNIESFTLGITDQRDFIGSIHMTDVQGTPCVTKYRNGFTYCLTCTLC